MENKWRPKEWDNPWGENHIREFNRSNLMCEMKDGAHLENLIRRSREDMFEEGAEAMLEALRKEGEALKGRKRVGFIWDEPMYGTLVFIPDKE